MNPIDFASGLAIGLIAAVLIVGAWLLRTGYGDPPLTILTGAAVGYFGGLIVSTIVFLFMLGEAFRPH